MKPGSVPTCASSLLQLGSRVPPFPRAVGIGQLQYGKGNGTATRSGRAIPRKRASQLAFAALGGAGSSPARSNGWQLGPQRVFYHTFCNGPCCAAYGTGALLYSSAW
jgi:hypothetical protein